MGPRSRRGSVQPPRSDQPAQRRGPETGLDTPLRRDQRRLVEPDTDGLRMHPANGGRHAIRDDALQPRAGARSRNGPRAVGIRSRPGSLPEVQPVGKPWTGPVAARIESAALARYARRAADRVGRGNRQALLGFWRRRHRRRGSTSDITPDDLRRPGHHRRERADAASLRRAQRAAGLDTAQSAAGRRVCEGDVEPRFLEAPQGGRRLASTQRRYRTRSAIRADRFPQL